MRKRRRFTPEFKAKVVPEVLTATQSPAEACRRHALRPNILSHWKADFLERAHTLFQSDERRDQDQALIAELEQLLGRATRRVNNKPVRRLTNELVICGEAPKCKPRTPDTSQWYPRLPNLVEDLETRMASGEPHAQNDEFKRLKRPSAASG